MPANKGIKTIKNILKIKNAITTTAITLKADFHLAGFGPAFPSFSKSSNIFDIISLYNCILILPEFFHLKEKVKILRECLPGKAILNVQTDAFIMSH